MGRHPPAQQAARYVLMAGLLAMLCGLAFLSVTTAMAGRFERLGRGAAALDWRSQSGTALALAAEAAVESGEYEDAKALAARSLEESPYQAGALRALARSAVQDGRYADAQRLMTRAAAMNMRDSESHAWLFEHYLGRRNYSDALLHADALMRRSRSAAKSFPWRLASLLSDDDAAAAIAARLGTNPPWRQQFLDIGVRASEAREFGDLLATLNRTGSPPDDAELSPYFFRLVSDRQWDLVEHYWTMITHKPSRIAPPYVYDGGFDVKAGPPPLNWQRMPAKFGAKAIFVDSAGRDGKYLRLQHDGFRSPDPLLQQLLMLPSGSYRLSVNAKPISASSIGRFKLELTCVEGARLASLPLGDSAGRWSGADAAVTVPGDSCEAQWLSFVPVVGERTERLDVWVADLAMGIEEAAASPRASHP